MQGVLSPPINKILLISSMAAFRCVFFIFRDCEMRPSMELYELVNFICKAASGANVAFLLRNFYVLFIFLLSSRLGCISL